MVNAVAAKGVHAVVLSHPGLAAVIAAEEAGRRDADPHAVGIPRIGENRVQAESAKSGCPAPASGLLVEAVDGLPGRAAILRDEQPRFGHAGIERPVRGVKRPDLIDEPAAAFQLAFEVHLGDEAVMLGIAAIFRADSAARNQAASSSSGRRSRTAPRRNSDCSRRCRCGRHRRARTPSPASRAGRIPRPIWRDRGLSGPRRLLPFPRSTQRPSLLSPSGDPPGYHNRRAECSADAPLAVADGQVTRCLIGPRSNSNTTGLDLGPIQMRGRDCCNAAMPAFLLVWLESAPLLSVGVIVLGTDVGRSRHRIRAANAPGQHRRRGRMKTRDSGSEGYVVSATLGLLALLLGFTFSLAIQRFETRRELVLADANAIGTAYLRVQLLDEPHRSRLSGLLIESGRRQDRTRTVGVPTGPPRCLRRKTGF